MHPSFADLHADFARELSGLSIEEVERHRDGNQGRWNARQIVEHLLLTYVSSSKVFQQRLGKGRPTLARPTLRQRMARVTVLGLGRFPGRPRAPDHVTPSAVPCEFLTGACLVMKLGDALQMLDEVLLRCEAQFGGQRFASHQILGPLSTEEWRRFHFIHSRHHWKQIQKLKIN